MKKEENFQLIPLITCIAMFSMFLTDSWAGGMDATEGFLSGIVATILTLLLFYLLLLGSKTTKKNKLTKKSSIPQ